MSPGRPTVQPPLLAVVQHVPVPDFDAEFEAAMRPIAEAYELAVKTVSPEHPRLDFFRGALRDARECAGLPALVELADAPRLTG